ncbi:hypothetical protein DPMN_073557 [Dreissena polymorpha]|uniref:Uncharacterized protein n=1 Tax=Dreissena polymorpha TaxID=45954 RepID=A0A9D4BZC8_DREPO|nr:hypothetical protein DPMN_073557 [Dreissena polymorpha]
MSHIKVGEAKTLQDLATTVTEFFIPLLCNEVKEGILLLALSILSLWCAKFYTMVPDRLIQWFKKAFTLRTSTTPVRNAYIMCMNKVFHDACAQQLPSNIQGDTLNQAKDLVPLLIQSMEKAWEELPEVVLVTEAVSAVLQTFFLSFVF